MVEQPETVQPARRRSHRKRRATGVTRVVLDLVTKSQTEGVTPVITSSKVLQLLGYVSPYSFGNAFKDFAHEIHFKHNL